jgi:hypothetical protein
MKRPFRLLIVFLFLFALLAGSVRPAQAAEFDNDGKIGADQEVNDDVFLSADQVSMNGTVNGMLFAAGETVTINGTVNGDAILVGSSVILSPGAKVTGNIFLGSRLGRIAGSVGGSLFGGAAAVTLEKGATIAGNLYYGGYSFQSDAGSSITRDALFGVYQAILNGDVQRDVYLGGAALELNGSVGRNLKAEVGDKSDGLTTMWMNRNQPDLPKAVAPGLRVAESAKIGGQLIYTSKQAQQDTINAQPAGGLVFQTPAPEPRSSAPARPLPVTQRFPVLGWLAKFIREIVTLLAFGALALWLLPAVFNQTVRQVRTQPGKSAGYGLLAIFSGYFSALVALVLILIAGVLLGLLSLGGLSAPVFGIGLSGLGLFVAVFSFLINIGSKVIVAYLVGQMLIERAAPQIANREIWSLIAGATIYALVISIPILGFLFGIVAALIGVGAMWLAYQSRRQLAVQPPLVQA